MKRYILLWIAALVLLIIYSCDVNYNAPKPTTKNTSCFKIINGYTYEPLDSVLLTMTVNYTEPDCDWGCSWEEKSTGLSDENGIGCVTYEKTYFDGYTLRCIKAGYGIYELKGGGNWFYINEDLPVKLYPLAYAGILVRNEAPLDQDDHIAICVAKDDPLNGGYVDFYGSDVDTTFITPVSPGPHDVSWTFYSKQKGYTSVTKHYFFNSNSTTKIEILY